MKTAVIYARYSSDRQTEQSIEGQVRVCKDFADKNDILIVGIYLDKAMTGTNDNRDDFQKMLADAETATWDIVLVYSLDRFGRNAIEIAINKQRLKKNKKILISATQRTSENIDGTKNLDGILLENVYIGIAEYYSAELSQKTKRGLNETRLKGNFIGGTVNYGYTLYKVENKEQKISYTKVAVNEEEKAVLQYIFMEYASGKRVPTIVKELNQKGILNRGKPFRTISVYYILRQEKYTGIYRLNGVVYDKIYPQIIPQDIFEIVKAKMKANSHGKHPKDKTVYLLKGKIFCGKCGKTLTSFTGTSKSGKINRYYKCNRTDECKQHKPIKKEAIEQAIISTLQNILSTEESFSFLLDNLMKKHNDKLQRNDILIMAEKELVKTNKSIANIMSAIECGIITETTKQRLEELEELQKELQEQILLEKTKEVKPLNRKELEEYLKYALSQPNQTLIDLLVDKVIVKDDEVEIYLKYTKEPPQKHKKKSDENNERVFADNNPALFQFTYNFPIIKQGRHYYKEAFEEYSVKIVI